MEYLTVPNILLGFFLFFNIALGFSIIFLERKDASATWAWLMVLLFIPIGGFLLYLIFGRRLSKRRIFTWDTKSKLGVKKAVQAQLRAIEDDEFNFKDKELAAYKDLFYMHLRNNDAIFTQDNDVRIFTDGNDKFNAMLDDLDQATDHIHLLYYIIRYDRLGKRITDTLIRKAQQGVEVRVLYDDMGSRLLSRKFIKRLRKAGAHVDAFFPPKIPR
ncbi:Cardiolipin synthase [Lentibacillus sp. JNUCC-1]|nr:Cardiolipin synthase [Lentibacillus sp. JNUCC-1]